MAVRLKLLAMVAALSAATACGAGPDPKAPLTLERTVALKGVTGRIDHMAIDVAHRRLYVAELGAGTVEAIDLTSGAALGRIGGLKEPQGLAWLPGRDELVVASGGDGSVRFYRAADLAPVGVVFLGADADDVRVDPHSGRIVVGHGAGALAVIDPASRKVVARLALPAHPEGFALAGDRVFVNLPDARLIVRGDLGASRTTASWTASHRGNFPMALDQVSSSLAVVYRSPPRLQVLDPGSGRAKADTPTCGDADDVFFDAARRRLYVICGTGAIDVFDTARFEHVARVATRPGARTGLFAPELDRLYVAARAGPAGAGAAIQVWRSQP